jgi:hypothetical protein
VEERKAIRDAIAAAAFFVWQDKRGVSQKAEGITRDMSGHGAFIYSAVAPTELVALRVEFELPPLEEGKAPIRLRVQAHVVRIEREPADPVHSGFAVQYDGGDEEHR